MSPPNSHRKQYLLYTGLSIFLVGVVIILNYSNSEYFQRFLGEFHPALIFLLGVALGLGSLSYLLSKGWLSIYRKGNLKKALPYFGWVIVFAALAIFIDWKIVYPADMNIPLPESLLFYPAMGFLVEIIFHLLPLTLLLLLATSISKKIPFEQLIWVCLVFVAMLEPFYQVAFMDTFPGWSIVLVWLNLFFLNLVQLLLFKKFDFLTMYSFRLAYYAIWHMAWAYLRLKCLF